MDNECIFCKIADKKIPSKVIYEDDDVLAFEDVNPQAPVHILVIPKKHIETLNELADKDLMASLLQGVKNAARAVKISSYRTVINTGKESGQEVFHMHFHILSGRPLKWPPG